MDTKLKDAFIAFDRSQVDETTGATRQWYSSMLQSLITLYGDMDISDITPDHIRAWREWLRKRLKKEKKGKRKKESISTHTLHGHLRAARRLFNWLIAEGKLETNPANRLRLPKISVGIPKAMADADLQALLNFCSKHGFKRDFAIIAFLADTGCRVGGLISLTRENLYLDRGIAYVVEKGDKPRPVFFGRYVYSALVAYLAERRDDNPAVWMGKRGPLTTHGVYLMLQRRAKNADVEGRVNPHSLRHYFARKYLQNGGDLATLGRLMGHAPNSDITATYYAVFADDELQTFHTRYSPLREIASVSISHEKSDVLRD